MKRSEKTQRALKTLTIEEKAALLIGKTVWESHEIERLGIPSVICSDGPSGLRRQVGEGDHLGLNEAVPATCFPSAATVANSWNTELAGKIGEALGEEAAALGVDFLLGPGLNIKRSPLCGRNFEYFSEDPYLAGKMAAGYVRGIQSQGVAACPKHFAVNSQESRRMAMNAVLDERTLREIYLTGFEIAVKEGGALSIMSSYNEVNGVYANENRHLLQEILRDDWGFEGIVITDWGASNDHTAGVAAGSNLEMPAPGYDSARSLIEDLKQGKISMEEIDACVGDLLETVFRIKKMQKDVKAGSAGKHDASNGQRIAEETLVRHHVLAMQAAAESIVLLKNAQNILPLDSQKRVVAIGDFAGEPRYQGAGSSNVNSARIERVSDLVMEYFPNCCGYVKGYERNSGRNPEMEKEALQIARQADVVLFFFGLDEISESEGLDRMHMRIPENQIALLEALAQQGHTIVGVLSGGSSIEMPWEQYCAALVHGYLGGQAGARAMLEVLTGKVNPSGKLNETYPFRYEDTPACRYFPAKNRDSQYREGIYIGYRYYDTAKVPVRYPFGYGLSYTSFAYSELSVARDKVSFTLQNTGKRDGAEVAQVYIGLPDGKVFRPQKELKGFAKIFLKAGESRRVEIALDDKAFRYWNVKTNRWEVETGVYRIMAGSNAKDIRLEAELLVKGTEACSPYDRARMEVYYTGQIGHVSDLEFEELLGKPLPEEQTDRMLTVNDAICQMAGAKSGLARLIYRILNGLKEKSEKKGKPDLNILFIYNMPFRGIAKMTNGMVSMRMAEGMVTVVNGHFFRGLGMIISGFFKNSRQNKEFAEKLRTAGGESGKKA